MSNTALEVDLDTSEETIRTDSIQAAEIISRLNAILNREDFSGKSRLSYRNLRGISRALAWNSYLFHTYGFRIETLDTLIAEKTQWALSIHGEGREQMIRMVEAVKAEIRASGGVEIADRLFGGNAPPSVR